MDIGSILLILALAILVSLFISRPLFAGRSEDTPLEVRQAAAAMEHERSALLAEQERVLNALQELDFDNTLGKIPTEDYSTQRTAHLQNGVAILQRLDALNPSSDGGQQVSTADAVQQLEDAVAVRRADSDSVQAAAPGEDLVEDLIAARRRARQEQFAGFCPKCGRPVQKSDKFCARCGTPVT
ncbi:MAG: zinc ribbon domain-containing protein [Anaerolineaceae bacterium]|nr:zinc ribbon domain-containing protein [Anaerolineaceae bacterium]